MFSVIRMARAGLPFLAALALSACAVELNTSIDNSAAEEAQVRAAIARQIEDHPGFAMATGPAQNPAASVKAPIADATISGPNYSFSASGRALFCVEIAYAGMPSDAPRRPARAEVAMRGSTGSLIAASTTISEERCTGSAAPRRFEELIALRQASTKR